MSMARMMASGLVLAALFMAGCNGSLREENELLAEENRDLRAQLDDRSSALESATQTARQREMEATRLRRELEESRRRAEEQPDRRTGFEGIAGVTGERGAGEVRAVVESDILFPSGSADLRSQAQQSLNQAHQVLNRNYAGHQIRVVGHTDTDPIRRSGFKSNYHLGFERAYSVREHLISRGISADRLHLASFGPHVPRETKDKSRRVEIIVLLEN